MRRAIPALIPFLGLLACTSPASDQPVLDPDLASPDAAVARPQVGDYELVATAPARTEGIAFGKDPTGATVLYVGAADALWRVLPDGTMAKVADVPSPVGIAVRADGDILVCGKAQVAGKQTAVIWRVTPTGTASILVGPSGSVEFKLTNFVAVAPDDKLVFSDSAADKLYMAEADGTGVKLVTDQISYTNGLAFSADGKSLLVASWNGGTVYKLARQAGGYGPPVAFTTDISFVDGITTLASDAYLFITLDGVFRVAPDHSHQQVVKIPNTVPANGASGRGVYGEKWLYLSNLFGGEIYRVYLGEPGAPLPAR